MIKIGNIELEHPIMNAAGVNCKTLEEVKKLTKTSVSAVVSGSFTKEPREGNTGETFYIADNYTYSINRFGVPNCGIDKVDLSHFKEEVTKVEKPFIISVLVNMDDCEYVIDKCLDFDPDLIELNLSCPNVYSFNYNIIISIMNKVMYGNRYKRFLVKLGPNSETDYGYGTDWTRLSDYMAGVVVGNTMPMAYGGGIVGGMGGQALKPISLGMVQLLKSVIPEEISLIGVGGIYTGKDVQEYLGAGADAVQIGTAYAIWGAKIFDRVLTEWINLQV